MSDSNCDSDEAEVKEKAYQLCKDFMGGAWATCQLKDFKIKQLLRGMSNLMYLCQIPDSTPTGVNEHKKVLLRLYGSIIQADPELGLSDPIVYGLLAEKGLGPSLMGVFVGGRLEEFVEHEKVLTGDIHQEAISREAGKILARFHKLRMPVKKDPYWVYKSIQKFMKDIDDNMPTNHDRNRFERLLALDLDKEFQHLKDVDLPKVSTTVFCHNDLQEGNLLYVSKSGSPKLSTDDWHLVPIDFEYSSYNSRGYDIANHFIEWTFNYDVEDAPDGFVAKMKDYPTEEQQVILIRAYIEEAYGTNLSTSEVADLEKQLLLEARVGAQFSHFFWAVWSWFLAIDNQIDFGYVEYALARFEGYFALKCNADGNPVKTMQNGLDSSNVFNNNIEPQMLYMRE